MNEDRDNPKSIKTEVNDLARDLAALAELQVQLLKAEIQASLRRMLPALGLVVFGIALVAGCLPTFFMGVAYVLVEPAGWAHWTSFLLIGFVGILVGLGLMGIAALIVRGSVASLGHVREELAENLRWVKDAITHGRRVRT